MDHFKPFPFPFAFSSLLQLQHHPPSGRRSCGMEKEPLAPSIEDRRNKAQPGSRIISHRKRSCPKCSLPAEGS